MKVLKDTELKALLTKLKSKFALANHTHTGYANSTHSHSVASTTAAGFAPQRTGTTTKFLRDDGTWAVPPDTKVTIDTYLNASSTNPVRNSVVTNALNGKAGTSVATTSANGLMSAADKTWIDKVKGEDCSQTGDYSHAEGSCTTASGAYSHAEGLNARTIGEYSHAEGEETETQGDYSHAEGAYTITQGEYAHAEGENTTANGLYSHAEGNGTNAKGNYSHAEGISTIASAYQHAEGCFNVEKATAGVMYSNTSNSLLIVGNGTSSTRSNAFRVTMEGKCYGKSAFVSSGADYAEYFEWIDRNIENEDRRGLFVALEGEKIRIAKPTDDYVLGVISATPLIVGDTQSETWKNMYKTDIYGSPIIETKEVEETTDKRGHVIPAHTSTQFVVNPDYNPNQEYKSREERPEWGAVGMFGKLIVRDDGSCQVNGYCKPAEGGIATKADTGYRVLARLDDTHIKILIK